MEHMEPEILLGYHMGYGPASFHKKSLLDSLKWNYAERTGTKGSNAFQIVMKPPQSAYARCALTKQERRAIKEYVTQNRIMLISHSGFCMNLGRPIDENQYAVDNAIDDLVSIVQCGGGGTVFHVGKACKGISEEECLVNMKAFIELVIDNMPSEAYFLLETAAGQKSEVLANLEDFSKFFWSFSEAYRKRLMIVIDTCHVFAAGYDLITVAAAQEFIDLVERTLKWENVAVIHLNDSKKELNCRVDRHESLTLGCITKNHPEGLAHLVYYTAQLGIPIILETPGTLPRVKEMVVLRKWATSKVEKPTLNLTRRTS